MPLDDLLDTPRDLVAFASDYPAGHRIAPHRHERAQLVAAADGVMTVDSAAGRWVVPPQRAVWVPAGMAHAVAMHGPVRMRSLYIRPGAAPGLPADCRVVAVSALLGALLARAASLPPLYDEAGADGRLVRVILDEIAALPPAPLHLPWPRDRRLVRVTEALLANPGDRRAFESWARLAGASPRTLARLFVRETGLGFRAWRQRARLMRALADLAEGTPVTAVALTCGYDSPSAFIAVFKRTFGTTPARYIRTDGLR